MDSIIVILVIWFTNVLVLYPLFKDAPFFGNYIFFSLVGLGMLFVYYIFSVAIHMIIGRADRKTMMSFAYVLIPHVMSGWFFSLALMNKWANFLYLIPLTWSVVLEFYLVRASTYHGMIYTVVVRFARDVIFFFGVYAFLRGWMI